MSKTWVVQRLSYNASTNQSEVVGVEVVYADTELEARTQGALRLKVQPEQVTVNALGAEYDTPADETMNAMQKQARAAQGVDEDGDPPDYMRSPGNVHDG